MALTDELQDAVIEAASVEENLEKAFAYRNSVFAKMEELRKVGDSMEEKTSAEYWPLHSYDDLVF